MSAILGLVDVRQSLKLFANWTLQDVCVCNGFTSFLGPAEPDTLLRFGVMSLPHLYVDKVNVFIEHLLTYQPITYEMMQND